MTYHDTRGLATDSRTFTDVILEGIAPGGGLFVPEAIPRLELENILGMADMPYHRRAAALFALFGVDIDWDGIVELMFAAYGGNFDDARIAPVEEVRAGTHVLELWHGPTLAFKDMALQCMPLFFSESISVKHLRGESVRDRLVLVATSGDTGKAALEGFADRPHTKIVVFYPAEGVSDIQRLQMVTQQGDNVCVFGVHGNFDDCQTAVKEAMADEEFTDLLDRKWGLAPSSANSINWGRMLPQIVYYVSAYADMVASGGVRPGEPMDICVPTGNFGNILGGYYAKRMGVPIGRLLCASNENNVLTDFIATGEYSVREREFVMTPSPSMDILISSNLERLLFHLTGDSQRVAEWASSLASSGSFRVDRETFGALREVFQADWVRNDVTLETIARVFEETGYLLDPHTAVAWEVAERLRGDDPVLVVSTAHWAKFGVDVLKALTGRSWGSSLPDSLASRGLDALDEVVRVTKSARVPDALAELSERPERFQKTIPAGKAAVISAVTEWLGGL